MAEEKGLEKGLEQGREEGLEQGLEQGFEQGAVSIAKNMSASGMSITQVAQPTGLSEAQIQQL